MNPPPSTTELFREAVAGPPADVPLARAALLIAQAERPQLDIDSYEREIEAIARDLDERLLEIPESDVLARARGAVHLVFEELRFGGDRDSYTDVRNLMLDQVIERRLGIPVTLALLLTVVGQRAGIDFRPVGLPGHVVVRLDVAGDIDPVFIDVFNGGKEISANDCRDLVRAIFGSRAPFRDAYLEAITPRQLLQRLLHNLKAGALRDGDEPRAARAIELLLALFPWDLDEIRDRGMLFERTGNYGPALEDLEAYLRYRAGARDADTIAEAVRSLRRQATGGPAEGAR